MVVPPSGTFNQVIFNLATSGPSISSTCKLEIAHAKSIAGLAQETAAGCWVTYPLTVAMFSSGGRVRH